MRITVTIDDRLLEHAQDRARSRDQTVGEVIEGSLRRELAGAEVPVLDGDVRPSWGIDLRSGGEISRLFIDEDSPRA